MDQEHFDYIWENFRYLLEPSTGYSRHLRAALFPVNPEWPDAGEVESLKSQYSREYLIKTFQEIEHNKNKYISRVYSEIEKDVYFNYCPSCKSLAVSPKSERCLKCKHEWYGTNEYRKNS
ncbi:hypothetical protein PSEUDO8Z_170121 [Pseudomonas sp. 8Z]|nr:hypothetical protein PSEUDO8Z_170121 [Pseudomonas sp. 8Z]